MKSVMTGATCTAAVLALSMAVFAQSAGQTPAQQPQTPAASGQPTGDQPITVTGCVQREADYRKANNIGRGGAVGTGVGVGNEFVLVSASTSTASAPTGGTPPMPAGTTGTAAAYEVTGTGESQLDKHVGKRVEIVGKLKSGSAPGAAPAPGAPKPQVDPMGQDLNIPEIEITSVKETTGTCPSTPSIPK